MTTLAQLVVKLIGDTSEFDDEMVKAQKRVQDTGKKMASAGKAMTLGLTLPLAAVGVAAVNAASDLEESLNKTRVVFGENADAIETWSKTAAEAFGLSQREALEAVGTFGNLFDALEITSEESLNMSQGLVQLAADLASFNNIDPTEALEKLRAGMVGEAEPLRTLGVNLSEAAVQAKAMEMGLAEVGEELSSQDKVMARYAIIMEQTSNAQGDFARTSDGLANQQRILKARLQDVAASLGTSLLPIAEDLVAEISDLAEWFGNLSPEIQATTVKIGGLVLVAGPLLTILGKITTILSPLITALGGVGSVVLAVMVALGLLGAKYADVAAEQVKLTEQSDQATISQYGLMIGMDTTMVTALGLTRAEESLTTATEAYSGAVSLSSLEIAKLVEQHNMLNDAREKADALKLAAEEQKLADAALRVAEALARQRESAENAWKANSQLVESLKGATNAEIAGAAIDKLTEAQEKGLISWPDYITAVQQVQTEFGLADEESRAVVQGLDAITRSMGFGLLPAELYDEALRLIIKDAADGALKIQGINTQLKQMALRMDALNGKTIWITINTTRVNTGGSTNPNAPRIPPEDLAPGGNTNVTVYGGVTVNEADSGQSVIEALKGLE
jgi:hypothetical protein